MRWALLQLLQGDRIESAACIRRCVGIDATQQSMRLPIPLAVGVRLFSPIEYSCRTWAAQYLCPDRPGSTGKAFRERRRRIKN